MWHLTTITHKFTQSLNSKILVLMVTVVVMGDIVIRTRFDEGTESAEAATSAWVLQVRRAEVATK